MGSQGLLFDGDIELLDQSAGEGFAVLEGSEFGSPVPIEVVLSSFLRDGAIVSKKGDENRELSFLLEVSGKDTLEMNDREARLNRAVGRPSTIVWTPPDGIAPSTLFKVVTSRLENPPYDTIAELRFRRTYTLRLTCLPHGYSTTRTTEDAPAAPSSGTIADACESTTGWTNTGSGAAAAAVDSVLFAAGTGSIKLESGPLQVVHQWRPAGRSGDVTQALNTGSKTLSVATGTGGYMSVLLQVDWNYSLRPSIEIQMTTSAAAATTVTTVASEVVANGFVRYSWAVPASVTVTKLDFRVWQFRSDTGHARPYIRVDSITLATSATTSQSISKTIEVGGSARTPGSLHVASPSDSVALGQVFVMTVPQADVLDGFQPGARRHVTQGTTTTDATALGGSYFTVNGTYATTAGLPIFDVPVSILAPGPYRIVALVKNGASPLLVGVQAQLRIGSTSVGPTSAAEVSVPNSGTLNNTWRLITVGTIMLPPLGMQNPASNAVARLLFKGSSLQLADVFMVPETAAFSIVDCGSSTVSATGSSSHLWIDSPDPDQPLGGWWRGTVATRDNVRGLTMTELKNPGNHIFEAGTMLAACTATNAAGPNLSLEYVKAWHTNAAS